MAIPQAVEYDAQGKPLPTSPQGVEYDAEGKPLSAPNAAAPKYSGNPYDPNNRTPTGEPLPGDNRNGFQRTLDNLITPDPRREEWQGPVRNAADSFSRGVAENVLPFVSHPLKSGLGVLKSLGGAIANSGGTAEGFGRELAKPMIESAMQDYQDRGPALAIPHMVGQGAGALATGEFGGAATKAIIPKIAQAGGALRTAAIGDTDAAALRGLRVPAGSPKSLRTVSAVQSSRPYLQGVSSLEDLQGKLPGAKSETWGPYQKTVDAIGDTKVKGPDGETTISALEAERKQLSALNRGLKTGNPESMQVAQQKGMNQAELLDREKAVQAALDPRLQEAGIDPQAIRQQFGQLKTIEGRVAGRSTLAEKPQPYGFGKMLDIDLKKPNTYLGKPMEGLRDLAAGRPLWSGKPTDISLREAFRQGGEKPNFGEFKPGALITSVPPLFAADRGLVRPTEPLMAPDFIRKPKIDTWTGRNQ